ncbi:kinase-like protein [Wolfiporia cocos MD-104 SS10]|uniref:non-specific serine/threonine protein kinase n=1 Tax=Wolfiporia cocos (strain MD-104) TaxID=742152 RepID=A0A2H3JFV6_WOLCO|nr:kinase-like protein [Wolfiporia cocos MD-104 SS10]
MVAATLLPQHSSNPLEVPSSDVHNKAYRRGVMRAQELERDENEACASSDDVPHGYRIPEMEQYRSPLAKLYPQSSLSAINSKPTAQTAVDVAVNGMHSDDEVFISAEDHIHYDRGEEEEDNDEGEDTDQDNTDLDDDDDRTYADGSDRDAHAETDEEHTIYLRPREEQEEIEQEIAELELAVPQLIPDYKIVDRLGAGTFSSVYKAIDLGYHSKWDNAPWHGSHPPNSSAYYQSVPRHKEEKVFVAIKRIYVTSGPERIRNEISIIEDCRGCRHTSQLITAFREQDQVVAIMPYHRNQDFREYYRFLPMEGIKAYFRCMFRALRDIHARAIIHRDVKPANFLFDPRTGIGTLCDFGLACRIERGLALGVCLHTAPSREHPHGRIRSRDEFDVDYIKRMQKEGRQKSAMPSEKVGYPEKDNRPVSKANRAGTRGFRAPEVLLKCGEQTGAIDVWSAGMILLFFLTGKFPLFHSSDDIEALMEIATIIGKKKMEKVATLHSRVFQSNIPSLTQEGMTWREFVEKQNPHLREPREYDPRMYPYSSQMNHNGPPTSSSPSSRFSPGRSLSPAASVTSPDATAYAADIKNALDLLELIMEPEATRRITPRTALTHPFLREPDAPSDDEFFPHPFGEGICGEWHFIDEETDDLCVRVFVPGEKEMVVRRLVSGEGIAIGSQPCEFHREEDGYR